MNSEIEKLAAELEPDAVVERFVAVLPPGVMGKLLAETGIDTLAAKEAVDNFFKLAELIGRVGSCDPLTALREIAEVDQLPRTPVNQKRSAVTIPVESRYPASAQENNVKPRGQRVRVVMPHGAGQYLLEELRNPKYPERLGKTRFPGGEIEDGETPEQAAVRELREELGVTIDPKAFKRLGVLPHHEFDCDEHYLQLDNHGVQPGTFDNAVGGDARVHLISGAPHGDSYYGPDVSKLLEGTSPTGPAQAGGAGLLAIKKIAAFDMPGVGVRHATIASAGGVDTMTALRLAKQHSDAFRYNQKLAILREMITTSPSDWYIDSELNNTWGISHSSGWKFHLPKSSISDLNIRTAIKPRTPSIPTDLYTL
jgi:8-oxo-dGTP pyrophosphatase MutT (NUDIX family)